MSAVLDALATMVATSGDVPTYLKTISGLDYTQTGFDDDGAFNTFIGTQLAVRDSFVNAALTQAAQPFPFPLTEANLLRFFPSYADTGGAITVLASQQLNTAAQALSEFVLGDMFKPAAGRNQTAYGFLMVHYLGMLDSNTGEPIPGIASTTLSIVTDTLRTARLLTGYAKEEIKGRQTRRG